MPEKRFECVQDLFDRWVGLTPDATAIHWAGQSLSYRALNARANALAHRLRRRGIGPEDRVALCADRTPALVIGLLAILKAGAAYMPLDHTQPLKRLRQMVRDGEPAAILNVAEARQTAASLAASLGCAPLIDAADCARLPAPHDEVAPDASALRQSHLAYLIYTSGSTGAPKGVMVEHRNVLNYLQAIGDLLQLGPGDVVAATTTIGFDIAVTEILAPLAHGAAILMLDHLAPANAAVLCAEIVRNDVSVLQFTPSAWRMLLASGEKLPRCQFISGGEALDHALAAQLLTHGEKVWNLYGPTETTVWSSADRIHKQAIEDQRSPAIGSPLANTRIHLLDDTQKVVTNSAVGEIYIAGAGVARGYWRQPGLTAAQFVDDPSTPGGKMYRTGDLGRRRPDGAIEYCGRSDQQIKIRGVRVEIAEIEAHLLAHPAIRDSVVVAANDGARGKRLVAYVVAANDVDGTALAAYLNDRLPRQMIPDLFVLLDRFPLSPSGKRDLRQLPVPNFAKARAAPSQLKPEERALADIWCELLGVEHVGPRDNFFDIGGNSLLVLMLLSRVRDVTGVTLDLEVIFNAPTLADMASHIAALPTARAQAIT